MEVFNMENTVKDFIELDEKELQEVNSGLRNDEAMIKDWAGATWGSDGSYFNWFDCIFKGKCPKPKK